MTDTEVTLRIKCQSDQPRFMVAAVAAAGAKTWLVDTATDVHITLIGPPGEDN